MRKNYETTDLLQVIIKAKKPLTADQIAKAAKSIRSQIAPFLKLMVSNGQLVEHGGEETAATYSVSEDTKSLAEAAKASSAKPSASISVLPTSRQTQDSIPGLEQSTAPASVPQNVHKLELPPAQLESEGKQEVIAQAVTDPRLQVLYKLAAAPMFKAELVQQLGDIEAVLVGLKNDGLISEQYIISDYTMELTDLAYAQYPELKDPDSLPELSKPAVEVEQAPAPQAAPFEIASVVERQPAAQSAIEPASELKSTQVEEAPVAEVAEPVTVAPVKAPVTPVAIEEPVAPAPAPAAPAPAAAPSPAAEPSQPAIDPSAMNDFGDLSIAVGKMVEKLFNERLGNMVKELESRNAELEANRETFRDISSGITECTKAFETAIGSLNKLASKLAKLG